jgi:integrase
MSYLFKQGDYWHIGFYQDGKEIRRTLRTKSKQIARKIQTKIDHDLLSGKFNLKDYQSFRKDLLLHDFLDQVLELSRTNKGPRTASRDETVIKNFKAFFSYHIRLKQITHFQIEQYKVHRLEKISNSTMNIELRHLSSMFSQAVKIGYLNENPFRKVSKVPVRKKLPVYLSKDQAEKLLDYTKNRAVYNAILIALSTGARVSEICSLKWDDVDLKNEMLTLDGKGRKERVVPIPNRLLEHLKNIKKEGKYILTTSRSRDDISHQFRKYADEIDLNTFKFHNLRDTYASWLVQQGTPLKIIQELLGHEDIKTTMIYAHIAPENKEIAKDQINRMI